MTEDVAYQGIGETLRATRQRMGLDLQAVAAQLRIRYPHLQAMEAGRFEELPGRIYAIGFLRTYGEHLGLDPDAVVEAFKQETSAIQEPGRLVFPIPAPETRTPRGWLIVLCLIVAGGLYGGWYYSHSKARLATELIPSPMGSNAAAPPAAPIVAAPRPVESPVATVPPPAATPNAGEASADKAPGASPAVSPPALAAVAPSAPVPPAAPVPSASAVSTPASPVAVLPAPAPPAEPAVPMAPAAEPPKPPPAVTEASPVATASTSSDGTAVQTFGSTEGNVRVVLRAHGDSWIDVRGANNEVLFPGHVLHDGDIYRVPNRSDAVLWTGNLGALEVDVDGKALPRIGQPGEARRNFSLDPKKLLAGAAH
jgi:cytoskeletal protein RodZ